MSIEDTDIGSSKSIIIGLSIKKQQQSLLGTDNRDSILVVFLIYRLYMHLNFVSDHEHSQIHHYQYKNSSSQNIKKHVLFPIHPFLFRSIHRIISIPLINQIIQLTILKKFKSHISSKIQFLRRLFIGYSNSFSNEISPICQKNRDYPEQNRQKMFLPRLEGEFFYHKLGIINQILS